MQETCIFCKIIKGEIPCAVLLDTKDVLAFLDINPARPGHTLIIPKLHVATILDLPSSYGDAVFDAMRELGKAVMEATSAQGFNIIQNNFPASGQEVPHIHWHLIPRTVGDGLAHWPQGSYATMDEMQHLASRIATLCKKT